MGVASLYGLWKGKKKSKDCNKKTMLTFEIEGLHHDYLMITLPGLLIQKKVVLELLC